MRVSLLVPVLALAACSQVEAAKEAVAYDLIDPTSAQFREVEENDYGNICGQVNAKNRMGAYVGYVPFYAEKSGDEWETEIIDADDYAGLDRWREKCEEGYAAFKNLSEAVSEKEN